jgi:hypothetical protein
MASRKEIEKIEKMGYLTGRDGKEPDPKEVIAFLERVKVREKVSPEQAAIYAKAIEMNETKPAGA